MEQLFGRLNKEIIKPKVSPIEITKNGTYSASDRNLDGFSEVDVDVFIPQEQEITIYPETVQREILPSSGKLFSKVTAMPVTSDIDSNITPENIKSGVTILGVTGNYAGSNKLVPFVNGDLTDLTSEDLFGITKFEANIFSNYAKLTGVSIPNTVTQIMQFAFNNCTGLTGKIIIPDSVTYIGTSAFYNCNHVSEVTIGTGITYIGDNAFGQCILIASMTILAVDPPTLANANALAIYTNYPIYVPSTSVDAYKAATNWASLASRIFAIQE